ncbi:unnamed protein product [Pedinophyceae sp. YPF-701]|nr:unnamed protein product [Pedinophyceae sp. YPF-701]
MNIGALGPVISGATTAAGAVRYVCNGPSIADIVGTFGPAGTLLLETGLAGNVSVATTNATYRHAAGVISFAGATGIMSAGATISTNGTGGAFSFARAPTTTLQQVFTDLGSRMEQSIRQVGLPGLEVNTARGASIGDLSMRDILLAFATGSPELRISCTGVTPLVAVDVSLDLRADVLSSGSTVPRSLTVSFHKINAFSFTVDSGDIDPCSGSPLPASGMVEAATGFAAATTASGQTMPPHALAARGFASLECSGGVIENVVVRLNRTATGDTFGAVIANDMPNMPTNHTLSDAALVYEHWRNRLSFEGVHATFDVELVIFNDFPTKGFLTFTPPPGWSGTLAEAAAVFGRPLETAVVTLGVPGLVAAGSTAQAAALSLNGSTVIELETYELAANRLENRLRLFGCGHLGDVASTVCFEEIYFWDDFGTGFSGGEFIATDEVLWRPNPQAANLEITLRPPRGTSMAFSDDPCKARDVDVLPIEASTRLTALPPGLPDVSATGSASVLCYKHAQQDVRLSLATDTFAPLVGGLGSFGPVASPVLAVSSAQRAVSLQGRVGLLNVSAAFSLGSAAGVEYGLSPASPGPLTLADIITAINSTGVTSFFDAVGLPGLPQNASSSSTVISAPSITLGDMTVRLQGSFAFPDRPALAVLDLAGVSAGASHTISNLVLDISQPDLLSLNASVSVPCQTGSKTVPASVATVTGPPNPLRTVVNGSILATFVCAGQAISDLRFAHATGVVDIATDAVGPAQVTSSTVSFSNAAGSVIVSGSMASLAATLVLDAQDVSVGTMRAHSVGSVPLAPLFDAFPGFSSVLTFVGLPGLPSDTDLRAIAADGMDVRLSTSGFEIDVITGYVDAHGGVYSLDASLLTVPAPRFVRLALHISQPSALDIRISSERPCAGSAAFQDYLGATVNVSSFSFTAPALVTAVNGAASGRIQCSRRDRAQGLEFTARPGEASLVATGLLGNVAVDAPELAYDHVARTLDISGDANGIAFEANISLKTPLASLPTGAVLSAQRTTLQALSDAFSGGTRTLLEAISIVGLPGVSLGQDPGSLVLHGVTLRPDAAGFVLDATTVLPGPLNVTFSTSVVAAGSVLSVAAVDVRMVQAGVLALQFGGNAPCTSGPLQATGTVFQPPMVPSRQDVTFSGTVTVSCVAQLLGDLSLDATTDTLSVSTVLADSVVLFDAQRLTYVHSQRAFGFSGTKQGLDITVSSFLLDRANLLTKATWSQAANLTISELSTRLGADVDAAIGQGGLPPQLPAGAGTATAGSVILFPGLLVEGQHRAGSPEGSFLRLDADGVAGALSVVLRRDPAGTWEQTVLSFRYETPGVVLLISPLGDASEVSLAFLSSPCSAPERVFAANASVSPVPPGIPAVGGAGTVEIVCVGPGIDSFRAAFSVLPGLSFNAAGVGVVGPLPAANATIVSDGPEVSVTAVVPPLRLEVSYDPSVALEGGPALVFSPADTEGAVTLGSMLSALPDALATPLTTVGLPGTSPSESAATRLRRLRIRTVRQLIVVTTDMELGANLTGTLNMSVLTNATEPSISDLTLRLVQPNVMDVSISGTPCGSTVTVAPSIDLTPTNGTARHSLTAVAAVAELPGTSLLGRALDGRGYLHLNGTARAVCRGAAVVDLEASFDIGNVTIDARFAGALAAQNALVTYAHARREIAVTGRRGSLLLTAAAHVAQAQQAEVSLSTLRSPESLFWILNDADSAPLSASLLLGLPGVRVELPSDEILLDSLRVVMGDAGFNATAEALVDNCVALAVNSTVVAVNASAYELAEAQVTVGDRTTAAVVFAGVRPCATGNMPASARVDALSWATQTVELPGTASVTCSASGAVRGISAAFSPLQSLVVNTTMFGFVTVESAAGSYDHDSARLTFDGTLNSSSFPAAAVVALEDPEDLLLSVTPPSSALPRTLGGLAADIDLAVAASVRSAGIPGFLEGDARLNASQVMVSGEVVVQAWHRAYELRLAGTVQTPETGPTKVDVTYRGPAQDGTFSVARMVTTLDQPRLRLKFVGPGVPCRPLDPPLPPAARRGLRDVSSEARHTDTGGFLVEAEVHGLPGGLLNLTGSGAVDFVCDASTRSVVDYNFTVDAGDIAWQTTLQGTVVSIEDASVSFLSSSGVVEVLGRAPLANEATATFNLTQDAAVPLLVRRLPQFFPAALGQALDDIRLPNVGDAALRVGVPGAANREEVASLEAHRLEVLFGAAGVVSILSNTTAQGSDEAFLVAEVDLSPANGSALSNDSAVTVPSARIAVELPGKLVLSAGAERPCEVPSPTRSGQASAEITGLLGLSSPLAMRGSGTIKCTGSRLTGFAAEVASDAAARVVAGSLGPLQLPGLSLSYSLAQNAFAFNSTIVSSYALQYGATVRGNDTSVTRSVVSTNRPGVRLAQVSSDLGSAVFDAAWQALGVDALVPWPDRLPADVEFDRLSFATQSPDSLTAHASAPLPGANATVDFDVRLNRTAGANGSSFQVNGLRLRSVQSERVAVTVEGSCGATEPHTARLVVLGDPSLGGMLDMRGNATVLCTGGEGVREVSAAFARSNLTVSAGLSGPLTLRAAQFAYQHTALTLSVQGGLAVMDARVEARLGAGFPADIALGLAQASNTSTVQTILQSLDIERLSTAVAALGLPGLASTPSGALDTVPARLNATFTASGTVDIGASAALPETDVVVSLLVNAVATADPAGFTASAVSIDVVAGGRFSARAHAAFPCANGTTGSGSATLGPVPSLVAPIRARGTSRFVCSGPAIVDFVVESAPAPTGPALLDTKVLGNLTMQNATLSYAHARRVATVVGLSDDLPAELSIPVVSRNDSALEIGLPASQSAITLGEFSTRVGSDGVLAAVVALGIPGQFEPDAPRATVAAISVAGLRVTMADLPSNLLRFAGSTAAAPFDITARLACGSEVGLAPGSCAFVLAALVFQYEAPGIALTARGLSPCTSGDPNETSTIISATLNGMPPGLPRTATDGIVQFICGEAPGEVVDFTAVLRPQDLSVDTGAGGVIGPLAAPTLTFEGATNAISLRGSLGRLVVTAEAASGSTAIPDFVLSVAPDAPSPLSIAQIAAGLGLSSVNATLLDMGLPAIASSPAQALATPLRNAVLRFTQTTVEVGGEVTLVEPEGLVVSLRVTIDLRVGGAAALSRLELRLQVQGRGTVIVAGPQPCAQELDVTLRLTQLPVGLGDVTESGTASVRCAPSGAVQSITITSALPSRTIDMALAGELALPPAELSLQFVNGAWSQLTIGADVPGPLRANVLLDLAAPGAITASTPTVELGPLPSGPTLTMGSLFASIGSAFETALRAGGVPGVPDADLAAISVSNLLIDVDPELNSFTFAATLAIGLDISLEVEIELCGVAAQATTARRVMAAAAAGARQARRVHAESAALFAMPWYKRPVVAPAELLAQEGLGAMRSVDADMLALVPSEGQRPSSQETRSRLLAAQGAEVVVVTRLYVNFVGGQFIQLSFSAGTVCGGTGRFPVQGSVDLPFLGVQQSLSGEVQVDCSGQTVSDFAAALNIPSASFDAGTFNFDLPSLTLTFRASTRAFRASAQLPASVVAQLSFRLGDTAAPNVVASVDSRVGTISLGDLLPVLGPGVTGVLGSLGVPGFGTALNNFLVERPAFLVAPGEFGLNAVVLVGVVRVRAFYEATLDLQTPGATYVMTEFVSSISSPYIDTTIQGADPCAGGGASLTVKVLFKTLPFGLGTINLEGGIQMICEGSAAVAYEVSMDLEANGISFRPFMMVDVDFADTRLGYLSSDNVVKAGGTVGVLRGALAIPLDDPASSYIILETPHAVALGATLAGVSPTFEQAMQEIGIPGVEGSPDGIIVQGLSLEISPTVFALDTAFEIAGTSLEVVLEARKVESSWTMDMVALNGRSACSGNACLIAFDLQAVRPCGADTSTTVTLQLSDMPAGLPDLAASGTAELTCAGIQIRDWTLLVSAQLQADFTVLSDPLIAIRNPSVSMRYASGPRSVALTIPFSDLFDVRLTYELGLASSARLALVLNADASLLNSLSSLGSVVDTTLGGVFASPPVPPFLVGIARSILDASMLRGSIAQLSISSAGQLTVSVQGTLRVFGVNVVTTVAATRPKGGSWIGFAGLDAASLVDALPGPGAIIGSAIRFLGLAEGFIGLSTGQGDFEVPPSDPTLGGDALQISLPTSAKFLTLTPGLTLPFVRDLQSSLGPVLASRFTDDLQLSVDFPSAASWRATMVLNAKFYLIPTFMVERIKLGLELGGGGVAVSFALDFSTNLGLFQQEIQFTGKIEYAPAPSNSLGGSLIMVSQDGLRFTPSFTLFSLAMGASFQIPSLAPTSIEMAGAGRYGQSSAEGALLVDFNRPQDTAFSLRLNNARVDFIVQAMLDDLLYALGSPPVTLPPIVTFPLSFIQVGSLDMSFNPRPNDIEYAGVRIPSGVFFEAFDVAYFFMRAQRILFRLSESTVQGEFVAAPARVGSLLSISRSSADRSNGPFCSFFAVTKSSPRFELECQGFLSVLGISLEARIRATHASISFVGRFNFLNAISVELGLDGSLERVNRGSPDLGVTFALSSTNGLLADLVRVVQREVVRLVRFIGDSLKKEARWLADKAIEVAREGVRQAKAGLERARQAAQQIIAEARKALEAMDRARREAEARYNRARRECSWKKPWKCAEAGVMKAGAVMMQGFSFLGGMMVRMAEVTSNLIIDAAKWALTQAERLVVAVLEKAAGFMEGVIELIFDVLARIAENLPVAELMRVLNIAELRATGRIGNGAVSLGFFCRAEFFFTGMRAFGFNARLDVVDMVVQLVSMMKSKIQNMMKSLFDKIIPDFGVRRSRVLLGDVEPATPRSDPERFIWAVYRVVAADKSMDELSEMYDEYVKGPAQKGGFLAHAAPVMAQRRRAQSSNLVAFLAAEGVNITEPTEEDKRLSAFVNDFDVDAFELPPDATLPTGEKLSKDFNPDNYTAAVFDFSNILDSAEQEEREASKAFQPAGSSVYPPPREYQELQEATFESVATVFSFPVGISNTTSGNATAPAATSAPASNASCVSPAGNYSGDGVHAVSAFAAERLAAAGLRYSPAEGRVFKIDDPIFANASANSSSAANGSAGCVPAAIDLEAVERELEHHLKHEVALHAFQNGLLSARSFTITVANNNAAGRRRLAQTSSSARQVAITLQNVVTADVTSIKGFLLVGSWADSFSQALANTTVASGGQPVSLGSAALVAATASTTSSAVCTSLTTSALAATTPAATTPTTTAAATTSQPAASAPSATVPSAPAGDAPAGDANQSPAPTPAATADGGGGGLVTPFAVVAGVLGAAIIGLLVGVVLMHVRSVRAREAQSRTSADGSSQVLGGLPARPASARAARRVAPADAPSRGLRNVLFGAWVSWVGGTRQHPEVSARRARVSTPGVSDDGSHGLDAVIPAHPDQRTSLGC